MKFNFSILLIHTYIGDNIDFRSRRRTVKIKGGSNSSTISIPITNDDIVEGDEMFTMNLDVPDSLDPGIIAGAITMANATIIDTDSRLHHIICIT